MMRSEELGLEESAISLDTHIHTSYIKNEEVEVGVTRVLMVVPAPTTL